MRRSAKCMCSSPDAPISNSISNIRSYLSFSCKAADDDNLGKDGAQHSGSRASLPRST